MTGIPQTNEVWLLNLGYVTEHSEQNLILYGYLSAPDVSNVELMIDVDKKIVRYAVVLGKKGHFRYQLQRWLEGKSGLLGKLALLLFLRRLGSYDPAERIKWCIRDYAGPSWTTSTEVLSVKEYVKRTSESGAEGWVFQVGDSEGGRTPQLRGTTTPPSPSKRKDV